jgi:hypothetical protein
MFCFLDQRNIKEILINYILKKTTKKYFYKFKVSKSLKTTLSFMLGLKLMYFFMVHCSSRRLST